VVTRGQVGGRQLVVHAVVGLCHHADSVDLDRGLAGTVADGLPRQGARVVGPDQSLDVDRVHSRTSRVAANDVSS
jgi:hypothetical protein